MPKKIQPVIITVITIVLVLGGLVLISLYSKKLSGKENPTDVPSTNGVLVSESPNFDFGNISMAAGKVSHIFKIKNSGTEPLVISKIYTSCMCTETTLIKQNERFGPFGMPGHVSIPEINQTLKANEEATVEAVFDPAAHGPAGLGQIERSITVENNGKNKMELLIKANVMP